MTEDIEGLDMLDILRIMQRKLSKFIAIMMQNLEEEFEKETYPDFESVRKIILDSINDYQRSVMRALIGGDVEPSR